MWGGLHKYPSIPQRTIEVCVIALKSLHVHVRYLDKTIQSSPNHARVKIWLNSEVRVIEGASNYMRAIIGEVTTSHLDILVVHVPSIRLV